MKRLMLVIAVFFTVFFVAPVWSHHPAEGIVSDEIWQMVDDQLTVADSPHLSIDFDDVMDSMDNVVDADGRNMAVTTITVFITDDDEDGVTLEDYTREIGEVVDAIEDAIAETSSRVPSASGSTESRTAPIPSYEVLPIDPDDLGGEIVMTEIILYEPAGSGVSQDGTDPINPDANQGG